MSTMYNLLHIPLCTVMLILIFNSTAYCHAHSFIFYILFFISYFSFILSYVYFPCVVFSIFALSMERTRLSFHCWLYSLCIVVYVTNKTWNLNLKLEGKQLGKTSHVYIRSEWQQCNISNICLLWGWDSKQCYVLICAVNDRTVSMLCSKFRHGVKTGTPLSLVKTQSGAVCGNVQIKGR